VLPDIGKTAGEGTKSMLVAGKERCIRCMHLLDENGHCAKCEFDASSYQQPNMALPLGTCLNERYFLGKVLGEGGFGITYVAWDIVLMVPVAVKEYFPSSLATRRRRQGFFCVQPFEKNATEFWTGHRHFLEEARILKECRDLPGIVTVYDFFEENQTAYIVMEYIEGLTLEQYIQTNGVLSASEMLELLLPLLHSLKKIHEKGLIHRDISPNNMILGTDNKLHLIDFGAAKIKPAHPGRQQTIILKKGYAPPEQYMASGNIGAWSDIYALCATIYYALSGQTPIPAIDRLQKNPPQEFTNFDSIPMQLAGVIERGLALQPAERYKTMDDFIYALEHPESVENGNTIIESASGDNKTFHRRSRIALISLCAAALATGGLLYAFRGSSAPGTVSTVPTAVPMAVKNSTPVSTSAALTDMESPVISSSEVTESRQLKAAASA